MWLSEACWRSTVMMKSSSGRCAVGYGKYHWEHAFIANLRRHLKGSKETLHSYIIVDNFYSERRWQNILFILFAADTRQVGLPKPLDQDEDETNKWSIEIESVSWNKKDQKRKAIYNKKEYEIHNEMRFTKANTIFNSTFWYVWAILFWAQHIGVATWYIGGQLSFWLLQGRSRLCSVVNWGKIQGGVGRERVRPVQHDDHYIITTS